MKEAAALDPRNIGSCQLGGRLEGTMGAALPPCLLVAEPSVRDLLFQAKLLFIHAIARPPTLSLITGMECDKPAPPGT